MIDLSHRSNKPEMMDGDDVSQEVFAACLDDLAQVNTFTLARRPTLAFIDNAMRAVPAGKEITILDVGYGVGDMLRAIGQLARERGRIVRLIGIDINPSSEQAARHAAAPGIIIEYRTGDAFAWPHSEQVDIIISSLMTHHMSDPEIQRFLLWMEETARLGWFVNDLHRHWFAYYGFRVLSAVMRWHPFVRHDGPLSVARAFTRGDWNRLLEAVKLNADTQIEGWFPFRYCLARSKW